MNESLGFTIIGVCIALYFLPTIIATSKNHKNRLPVFLVNLFLGWTVLGWVGALVWSVMHGQSEVPTYAQTTWGHGTPSSEQPVDGWSAGRLTHAAHPQSKEA